MHSSFSSLLVSRRRLTWPLGSGEGARPTTCELEPRTFLGALGEPETRENQSWMEGNEAGVGLGMLAERPLLSGVKGVVGVLDGKGRSALLGAQAASRGDVSPLGPSVLGLLPGVCSEALTEPAQDQRECGPP